MDDSKARSSAVAYLGPENTYSHLATVHWVPSETQLLPCEAIDEVFSMIEQRRAIGGVVPIYNNSRGLVTDTAISILRRLLNPEFRGAAPESGTGAAVSVARVEAALCISAAMSLPIRHCLISWGSLASIRRVFSKQQALDQCQDWLRSHFKDLEITATESSSAGLGDLASRMDSAAIVSPAAAAASGAPVILTDIQDRSDNWTEFVWVQLDSEHKQPRPLPSSFAGLEPASADGWQEYWVSDGSMSSSSGTCQRPAAGLWRDAVQLGERVYWFSQRSSSTPPSSTESWVVDPVGTNGTLEWRLGGAHGVQIVESLRLPVERSDR